MSTLKAYLAEKYMSGPKADAILSRVAPKKKKKRKPAEPSSKPADPTVLDDDGGLGDEGKEDDDVSEAVVASDRSFKKRDARSAEGGSGWITIKPPERSPTPPEELAAMQETVYRDSSGRKIDTKAERAEAAKKKREREEKEAQRMEWGKGLVQREEEEQRRQELEKAKTSHFSRTADDKQLNDELKAQGRWEDPSAAFLTKKRAKGPRRPEYTGPMPPPNRFGIKPGYRWDGVDRSNGFEKKFFQSQAKKQQAEQAEL